MKIDEFGMDTISLAGPLEAKLSAMRGAGFSREVNDVVLGQGLHELRLELLELAQLGQVGVDDAGQVPVQKVRDRGGDEDGGGGHGPSTGRLRKEQHKHGNQQNPEERESVGEIHVGRSGRVWL